jgi:hypothetical protein
LFPLKPQHVPPIYLKSALLTILWQFLFVLVALSVHDLETAVVILLLGVVVGLLHQCFQQLLKTGEINYHGTGNGLISLKYIALGKTRFDRHDNLTKKYGFGNSVLST